MLRRTALPTPGANGLNVCFVRLHLSAVGPRRQLHQRMQWDRHPGALFLRLLHEVGVDAANDGLVGDYENVLAPLEFHNYGLESDDNVAVALTAPVAVVVLVLIARLKIFRVHVGNLLVGHPIAHASVELV